MVSKSSMMRPSCHLHLPFLLLLLSLPPSLAAGGSAASTIDDVGFWLGFTLLVAVSCLEAAMSILWTRYRITSDGIHPCELSCRVCGREVSVSPIDPEKAREVATEGLSGGFSATNSATVSNGFGTSYSQSSHGCSCFGGVERRHSKFVNNIGEAVIDKFGSLLLVPGLLIRRFNPSTSLAAPAGLVNNVRAFFKPGKYTAGRLLEHGVHLLVGLADISLGVAGLALNPGSPKALYATVKDPKSPMTFENYSTLFLLYWLLGAVLAICIIPLRSARRSVQMFGCPGITASVVASLANVVLFALGCWKIDVARRAHKDWTTMLSYWIGGASALGVPCCGFQVFEIFGVVGLVFMLKHTF